jgi:hypothetical protein
MLKISRIDAQQDATPKGKNRCDIVYTDLLQALYKEHYSRALQVMQRIKNILVLSTRANYTDRATAACRRR